MTQETLKSKLTYDQNTGIFKWITTTGSSKKNKTAGCLKKSGYTMIQINKMQYYAHRLAWLYMEGVFPKEIDHKNQDRSDNRISNLREVTRTENNKNKSRFKNTKNKYPGVTYIKKRDKYQVYIGINGRPLFIGLFQKEEEAIEAKKKAEKKHGFYNNHSKKKRA